MRQFLFVLTRGLEDPTRVTRTLQMAKVAKETGNNVTIFLTDDGVLLVKNGMIDNVVAPTGDEAASHFHFLIEHKVPFYVCIPCAEARQISEKDLYATIQFAGVKKLLELTENATVFSF